MVQLNMRQVSFIKHLLKEKSYNTLKYFSELLSVSEKTLQKDLNQIEKYLRTYHIQLDRKPGTGIRLEMNTETKLLLYNNLQMQENEPGKISIHERRMEILKHMLTDSQSTTSIQKLSDKYFIGKASIANDLKYIEEWLSQYHLHLLKTVGGTRVEGAEMDIRRAIASLLFEYTREEAYTGIVQDLAAHVDAATMKALSELFEKENIRYVNERLSELEKKYNCKLYDPYYINLLTHILISITRGAEGKGIQVAAKDQLESEQAGEAYQEAAALVERIKADLAIDLADSEIYYLYQYFISSGLVKTAPCGSDGELNKLNRLADEFVRDLTSNMEEIMQLNVYHDTSIMEGLLLHIRPMLNRMDYDIQISNPLMDSIADEYPELLNICKAATLLTSYKLMQKKISMDEIGYIALYYQLALERSVDKKQVLVVCHSGYGTSQLLAAKLKRAFPQWDIVDVLSVNKLKQKNMESIDFIISTVPLENAPKPYFLVSAFLSDQDVKNISDMLLEKSVGVEKRKIGTQHINQYLEEENIFFHKTQAQIQKILQQKYDVSVSFERIILSETVEIALGFYSGSPITAISVNTQDDGKRHYLFVIAMDDTKEIGRLLAEIYHLHTSGTEAVYLSKCKKAKDIKNYFAMNKGEKTAMEIKLSQVIKSETIKLDLDAKTKEEALEELTALLEKSGVLSNAEAFLKDVYYRESLGCTGIGNGIAIPHGKSKFVSKTSLAFGKTKQPIAWETLDDEPVQFIILFAVTEEDKDSAHVRLLSQVAGKLGDDDVCEKLLHASTPEEVYQIFTRE